MLTDPTLILVTTTAALPREGEVVGDFEELLWLRETLAAERSISNGLSMACCKTKIELADLKAELAKRDEKADALPIPPSSPGVIELLHEVDATIRYFRHRHLNRPDCEAINLLETAREGIVGMPCDAWMTREEHDRQLTSLRSQLARAGAIEAKAKAVGEEVLAWIDPPPWRVGTKDIIDRFRAALAALGSPDPEVAKPTKDKCPHCGTHFGPENLTCGECGRWLAQAAKPAASPVIDAAARLAILERVAKTAKDFFRGRSEDPTDDVYTLFRLAVVELAELEAS